MRAHLLPLDGPPVSALWAGSPPGIQEATDAEALKHKVTAARQLAYLFDDNEAFATAVGLQPEKQGPCGWPSKAMLGPGRPFASPKFGR